MLFSNQGHSLQLRRTTPQDAAILLRAYQDESFMRLYHSNHAQPNEEQLTELLRERERYSPVDSGYLEWLILHKQHGAVGVAALGDYSPIHHRAEFLIGLFDKQHRSLGYGTEATLLVLDLAFNAYHLNKIYAYVYEYNQFAQQNMLKFGFQHEGTLEKHHYWLAEKKFIDLYLNGITVTRFRHHEKIRRYSLHLLGRDVTQPYEIMKLSSNEKLSATANQWFLIGLQKIINHDNKPC
jgi:ribosomal-protein-alanine N-acetyltransferase